MGNLKKICWKLIPCFCLLLFFIVLGVHNPIPVYSQTDNEPNDDYSTASPLVLNGRNTGQLDTKLDSVDFWSFTINKDGEFTKIAAIFDTSLQFYLSLYDSDGATVLYNATDSGSSPHVFGPFGLKAGTYYIKLKARDCRVSTCFSGQYTLDTYYADQLWENDVEPNVNSLEAKPMNANGITTGHLGYRGGDPVIDTEDWWSITSDTARNITFSTIFDTSLQFYLSLYDSDGATVLYNATDSGSSGQKIFGPFSFIAGKTYYIKLKARDCRVSTCYYGGYRFDTGNPNTTTTINPITTSSTTAVSTTTTTTADSSSTTTTIASDNIGALGGPCYPNGTCNTGLECKNNICAQEAPNNQGEEGGTCYVNGTCNTGLVCNTKNICEKETIDNQGDLGEECYANGSCNTGLTCNADNICEEGSSCGVTSGCDGCCITYMSPESLYTTDVQAFFMLRVTGCRFTLMELLFSKVTFNGPGGTSVLKAPTVLAINDLVFGVMTINQTAEPGCYEMTVQTPLKKAEGYSISVQ